MGAFIYPVHFPVVDGLVVTAIRNELTSNGFAPGLTVQRQLPDEITRRMATVRNDGGPQEGMRLRRSYGINLWADYSRDCEVMAQFAMTGCRVLAGTGAIASTDQFTGPYEIEDEPRFSVDGKLLSHFYFTFRATIRGTNRPLPDIE